MAANELQRLLSIYMSTGEQVDLNRVVSCIDSLGFERVHSLLDTLSHTNGTKVPHLAAYTGNTKFLTHLLDRVPTNRRADLLSIKDSFGRTSLHWACIGEHSGTFAALFESLPDVDTAYKLLKTQDILYRTAVHYSAYAEDGETMEYLLRQFDNEKWFDLLMVQTRGGSTPVSWAAAMNWTQKIEAMLEPLTAEQQLNLLNTEEQLPEILASYRETAENALTRIQTQANRTKIEMLEREDLRNKERIAQLESELATCKVALQTTEAQYVVIQEQEEKITTLETKCDELHMQLQGMQHQMSAATTSAKKSLAKLADSQQELSNGICGTDVQVEENRKGIEGVKWDVRGVDLRQLTTEEEVRKLTEMMEIIKDRLHEVEHKPG